jgi:hypothetical protein
MQHLATYHATQTRIKREGWAPKWMVSRIVHLSDLIRECADQETLAHLLEERRAVRDALIKTGIVGS